MLENIKVIMKECTKNDEELETNRAMTESRTRLFLENILIYGLGSAMNMVIPFIMLPIITRLLPGSEYYGINDSVVIFVAIGSAIAMMGMYDAMYRFYFDKEDAAYRKEVCSSALFTLVITGFVALLIAVIFQYPLARLLFSTDRYSPLMLVAGLNIWVTSINTIVAAPTRMKNQRMRFIAIQTLAPIISYSIAIWLIIKGEYVYALPLASLLSNVAICIIFAVLNKQDFSLQDISKSILKQMLKFGVPLMPTFLFFWILSSLGRIVITNTWGIEYTGIYAAAGKLAAISQLIYAAFSGGWQYFAFSTMHDEDYVALISRVFDYLAGVSFFATAALILVLKPIYNIMLPEAYAEGITIVPILFLAPLILMLRQTIGMHFQVKKQSILSASTIGFGAFIAVVLYYLLIPRFGISGAAVGSLTGYVVSLLLTIGILFKMKSVYISKRIYAGSIITLIVLVLHMSNISIGIVHFFAFIECTMLFVLYCGDINLLIKQTKENNRQVIHRQ